MPIKITVVFQYDAVKTGINLMISEDTAAVMETPQGGSSETSVSFCTRRQDVPYGGRILKGLLYISDAGYILIVL